ncbi:MAG: polyphosphate:AMP phosphotransferase [Oscillospiraceae bacterium]|nr:polyphosphate:AMP phosphotransferase [Oscillospiraceae bacterium]
MLENAITNKNKSFDYKDLTKELEKNLSALQQQIRNKKLPVIILLEGWGASGKGTLIKDMIKMLDPRFFKVFSTMPASETERRYPMMKRFWEDIPEYGTISVLDRSWYQELAIAKMEDGISADEYARRIHTVNTFERQLTDDGYLIVKFFLHISQKEQKKRFLKLKEDSSTKWRVTELDKMRHKNYNEYYKQFNDMLTKTNTPHCPWRIIDTTDRSFTRFQVFNILVSQITNAVNTERTPSAVIEETSHQFELSPCRKLAEVKLENKSLQPTKYVDELKKAQKELAKLHGKIYKKKISVILLFEGWDAAGKGGAIKRVSYALDPRGYEAVPIAAPDKHELNHHYLWRFWNHLPKSGHITIFDRSWYGRVMVERLEGFTPPDRCAMAYREINEFEAELSDEGIIILKFWMQIDKDEQLKRFNDRLNTPEKQWKITDEDWRNREKWDQYEEAVNEMIAKTSTKAAPWHIIEANDKLYARIKVMNTIIDALSARIKNQ